MANNKVGIEYIITGYNEASRNMKDLLTIEKEVEGKKTIEINQKGFDKVLSDYEKLGKAADDLQQQLSQLDGRTKLFKDLQQQLNTITATMEKMASGVNKYGDSFNKTLLQNINNTKKLGQEFQQVMDKKVSDAEKANKKIEQANARAAKAADSKKQFENQQREAENTLRVWQDAYRKIEKAKNDSARGKQLTPSEYSYLKETLSRAEKELNKMTSGADKFSGKFKGAAQAAKDFKKYIQDAMQFTKDNAIETNARDNLIDLEKQWESLESKKQKYTQSLGEDARETKEVAAQQTVINQQMEEEITKLEESLQLRRNIENLGDKELEDAMQYVGLLREQFLGHKNIQNAVTSTAESYNNVKAKVQEVYALEEKLEKLKKNPSKNRSQISYIEQLIAAKKEEYNLDQLIAQLPKKQRDAIQQIINKYKEKIELQRRSNEEAQKEGKQFGETLKNFAKFTVYYMALQKMKQLVNEMLDTMKELDKAFTDIQMVTEGTDEETAQLADDYNKLAREMGATTQQVAEGASEWLRQGKTAEETTELLKASMTLSKVGAMESSEATELLTSSLNGYQFAASEAMSVVDKLSAIDLEAATSSEELAVALSRTANMANNSGVSFDKLLGIIGTVSSVTRRSAETIRRSL